MRKFLIGVAVLLLLIIGIGWFVQSNLYNDFQKMDYTVEGKTYHLLVADTPAKWEQGLMFYKHLWGVNGMIFLFPDTNYRTFWNKNTLMNLKLLWIDHGTVVGTSLLPSITSSNIIMTVSSPKPANIVIELEQ